MVRSRPRWQLTTRARSGAALGVPGLAVAGVQLALMSSPPTVVQIVVVAFWSVVGLAYLGSAVGQVLLLRRAGALPPPMPGTDAADVVPVPVRPARPRATTPPSPPAGHPVAARHAVPAPEETTDAFTVRAVGLRSTLSFGPARVTTVPPRPGHEEARRPAPPSIGTIPAARPPGPRHQAVDGPAAPAIPAPRGARHRAPAPGTAPAPAVVGPDARPAGR